MRLKSAGRAKRHPLWSKEQFLEDLGKYRVIKRVCEIYADETTGWQGYNSDQWRWRKADPDFDDKVRAILADEGTDRPDNGRPRTDGGDKSWQEDYCKTLVESRLALDKAASATPYSMRQIQDFLDPVCSSYDEEFAKMVEAAELVVSSRAREMMVDLLNPDGYVDLDTAKITQTKGWVAFKLAEKLEPKKFGRKQVEISGTIDHRHQHRLLPREERIAMLDEDRQKFIEARLNRNKELPSGDREEMAVIEAEVVSDGS